MIEFEVHEIDRQLLLTLKSIDLAAASSLLRTQASYQSQTLPKVEIVRANDHNVSFYPDAIRIAISPEKPFNEPIERFQILKFDELLGRDTPIVVKKNDERKARMKRVQMVLEQVRAEIVKAIS